jgi:hypothetical protein
MNKTSTTSKKKLRVNKDTIRQLSNDALGNARGGLNAQPGLGGVGGGDFFYLTEPR